MMAYSEWQWMYMSGVCWRYYMSCVDSYTCSSQYLPCIIPQQLDGWCELKYMRGKIRSQTCEYVLILILQIVHWIFESFVNCHLISFVSKPFIYSMWNNVLKAFFGLTDKNIWYQFNSCLDTGVEIIFLANWLHEVYYFLFYKIFFPTWILPLWELIC